MEREGGNGSGSGALNRNPKHAKHPSSSARNQPGMKRVQVRILPKPTYPPTGQASQFQQEILNNVNQPQPEPVHCVVREQDQYMPIANVIRIMRRILPSYAKISDDAKETVQECVSEYISFITGEANDRCKNEQRKTITAEDIIWAMGKLGFDDYVEPLNLFLTRYRQSETDYLVKRGSVPAADDHGNAANIEMPPPPPAAVEADVAVATPSCFPADSFPIAGQASPGLSVFHDMFEEYYREVTQAGNSSGEGGSSSSTTQNALVNSDQFDGF